MSIRRRLAILEQRRPLRRRPLSELIERAHRFGLLDADRPGETRELRTLKARARELLKGVQP